MLDVKRIEIVINKPHAARVREMLDELGVPGLTVFETLAGYGDRGDREGGELSDAMSNLYLLTTCRSDQVAALSAALEPILRRYGRLCLISDAKVIRNEARGAAGRRGMIALVHPRLDTIRHARRPVWTTSLLPRPLRALRTPESGAS